MAKSIFQVNPVDAAIAEAGATTFDMAAPDLPAIEQPTPLPRAPVAAPSSRGVLPAKPSPALMVMFERAAVKYDVPLNVLMALGEQESRYNPTAIGTQTQWGRANGIMQYLPSTAANMGINPFDPAQSIDAAAKQLGERLRKGYSMRDAVMEHHGGTNRAQWGQKTARYGEEVLDRARRLRGELAPSHGNWYSPGATVDDRPQPKVDAGTIAAVTGRAAAKPAPSIGLADSIADPNSRPEILARYEREQARKRDEGGISATRQPRPTVRSVLGGLATSTGEAFEQARQGIRLQGEDLIGDAIDAAMPNAPGLSLAEQREEFGATNAERAIGRSQDRAAASTPEFDSWWADAAYGGLQSIAQTAPGIAAGIVGGAPLGLAILGGQTEAQAYGKYRARGATPGMALLGAVGEGGVEVATELLPMGYLTDKFGKAGFGEFLTQYFAREMPTEQLATFAQDAIDTAIANPDKTWGDFWAERGDAAGRTAVATLMQSGAFAGLNAAVGRIARDDAQQARVDIDRAAVDSQSPSVLAGDVVAQPRQPRPVEDAGVPPSDPFAPGDRQAAEREINRAAVDSLSPSLQSGAVMPEANLAIPDPVPAGPLARALDRAPLPAAQPETADNLPSLPEVAENSQNLPKSGNGRKQPETQAGQSGVAVPAPASADAQPTPMRLVTPVGEMSVSVIGETPDALWVRGMSGEELQIPRADIDAGTVQLLPPADPAQPADMTAEPFASDAQKPEDVKALETGATVAENVAVGDEGASPAVKQSLTVDDAARATMEQPTPANQPMPQAVGHSTGEELVDPQTGEIISAPSIALPSPGARAADPATDLSALDEPALRARLRTLSSNARDSGGWDKAKRAERKRIEAAIDALVAGNQAAPKVSADAVMTPTEPAPVAADQPAAPPRAPGAIEAAAAEAATSPLNELPEPTQAQKGAGNYRKGHVAIGGLDVSIENPAGTSRRPEWPPLKHSYGYVKRSEGADGDHVDVFLGPKADDVTNPVFIVDQVNEDGSFDEHKVMLGFGNAGAARRGYLANYAKGWKGLGGLTEMPFDQFKAWVGEPANTKRPASDEVPSPAPEAATPSAPPPQDYRGATETDSGGIQPLPPGTATAEQYLARFAEPLPVKALIDPANPELQGSMLIGPDGRVYQLKTGQTGHADEVGHWDFGNAVAPDEAAGFAALTSYRDHYALRAAARSTPAQERAIAQFQARARRAGKEVVSGSDAEADIAYPTAAEPDAGQSSLQNYQMPEADQKAKPQKSATSKPSPAPVQESDQEAVHRAIDADFAANRAVLGNFKKGDRVEFDHGNFYRDGTSRTFSGIVDTVQSKEQGTVRVVTESGGDYTVGARNLRHVEKDATPPPAKPDAFAGNKLFTADKVEAARARLKEKMNRINSGIDPEVLVDGMTIAGAYIEAGVRKFTDYAAAMRADFGERITPYLLSFWEGARNYPGLDTVGMSSVAESKALHDQIIRIGLPGEESVALGAEVAPPKVKKAPKKPSGARTLRDDWGVDHIDGYTPMVGGSNQQTDDGLKGGVKDAFLADAVAYLRAVASELRSLGFVPHTDKKGRESNPVSRNAAGPAVSGDVTLAMIHPETGMNAYVDVGGSSMRGAVPTTKAGVAMLWRVSQNEGDKYATRGVNMWAPVDLSAVDLADTIAWAVKGRQPEIKRAAIEPVAEPAPAVDDRAGDDRGTGSRDRSGGSAAPDGGRSALQGVDRGPVSPAEAGGRDRDQLRAGPDPRDMGAGLPEDVGASGAAGPDAQIRVRVPGDAQPDGAGESADGDVLHGRAGGSGPRVAAPDAGGAGTGGRGRERPAGLDSGLQPGGEGALPGDHGTAGRTLSRGRQQSRVDAAPDLFAAPAEGVPSAPPPAAPSPAREGPGNFLIANPLEIVGGGPVARFDRNRKAIETYNAITEEGRVATAGEQAVLAGYTGWGSYGQELFQGTWAYPRPKDGWQARDQWLRAHLGKEQWESAQRSITNAHYTDPPTVMAMWAMMERMGFAGGRVLEPSMGIGNFFGMMPGAVAARSQLAGIELDELTGGMAKLLYPDANVRIMPYQQSKTPDGFYDLAIGNWPFENTVIADRRYDRLSPFLHDYFFLKALDQVRPGGIVMGITSNGTMDKKASGIRRELAKKAELVAAFRLPSGAFEDYAGTKVVTDIVILRKRAEPIANVEREGWIESRPHATPAGPEVSVNEYYAANPGHVIGTINYGSGTTRGRAGLIVDRPADMAGQMQRIIGLVPQGAYQPERTAATRISYVANHTAEREGALTKTDAGLFIVRGEQLAPAGDVKPYALKDAKKTAARVDQLERLIDLRKRHGAMAQAEREGDAATERKALRQAYDAFVQAHGPLAESWGLSYLRAIDDPGRAVLAALEIDGKPAAILSRKITRDAPVLDNPTVADAYVLERNASVNPSLDAVAARAGVTPDEARTQLIAAGAVFALPDGDVAPSDIYLSGNVREKLRQAQAAVDEGMALERNVEALQAVVPADIPYFKIEVQLGATWVASDFYADYVAHMLGLPDGRDIEARYNAGRWSVRIPDRHKNRVEARTGAGSEHVPFQKLVNAAISNQSITIRRKGEDKVEYVDKAATDEVNGKISDMRTKFAEWLWSDPERRVAAETEYNETRNAFATPKFDGSFLRFEGMALSLGRGPFDLRKHQQDAIWRALVSRRSLNAHEVGTGKTFTMGGIAVESRRYGIARKPMILAHNANSATVAAEIQQMYPGAKILYIDNLSPDMIDVRLRQIANDDWDAVVLPHSLIDRLSFREDTLMEMAREEIAALEAEAYAAAEDDNVELKEDMFDDPEELRKLRSPTAKELVKTRQRIIESIRKQANRSSREGAVAFEELGIDMVMVDEAHLFKKPPISTRMKMKGLNTGTSDRSIALMFMTRYIRSQNNGGNVHLFTGTPITNTLTEIFNMSRYIMAEEMQAAGVDQWDGWFGSFAREVMDVELNAAAEYEAVTRLAGFINVPELRRMIGQYMDVVFASDMPEMRPRRTTSGKTMADELTEAERAELLNGRTEGAEDRPYKKVINVTSDLTPEQKVIFARLREAALRWRQMSGKQRRDAMVKGAEESPIIAEGNAAKASFDVRLMLDDALAGQEGKAPDDPGSKASKVVANVKEIYDSHPLATQVIFAQRGFSTQASRSTGERNADDKKVKRTVKTFSTMRDIVARLVDAGIPVGEIRIVDGTTSNDDRKKIARDMNAGKVRVVIGSTETLGVGVNMQRNLRAMHHMDAPWMPGDLEQRNGRGLRQGNQWNTVLEYRYLTDRLDGRRWQILAVKQKFITAFMKADENTRVIEGDSAAEGEGGGGADILQSFAEAAGDPRILIREKLRKQLDGVQRRERLHGQGVANALWQARRKEGQAADAEAALARIDAAGTVDTVEGIVSANAGKGFSVEVDGQTFDKRAEADDAMAAWASRNMRLGGEAKQVGRFGGRPLMMAWPAHEARAVLRLPVDEEVFAGSSMQGLERALRNYAARIEDNRAQAREDRATVARLNAVAAEPFHLGAELARYETALENLEADIQRNPVPPPAWLRAGAPVETDVLWNGAPFEVTGHRWNADGWFVLARDESGEVAIPYLEVKDDQGIALYEERPFEAPELIEKKSADATGGLAPAEQAELERLRALNAEGRAEDDDISRMLDLEGKAGSARFSIGTPSGGGFASVEGLRQHLEESRFGPVVGRLLAVGKIVLHADGSSLPGTGYSSTSGPAVISLSGDEFVADDMLSLGRAAQKWYRENLRGKRVTSSDGYQVRFARLGEGKIASGKGEDTLRAIPAIPAIIEKGRHSGPFAPSEKWAARGVVALHHYTAQVEIAGRRAAFGVSVHELADGRRQYNITNQPDDDVAESRFSRAEGRPEATTRVEITPGDSINIAEMTGQDNAVQAMTAPDGTVHLVADQLTSRTTIPVLLHEMFHAGGRPLLGDAGWNALMKRMGALYRAAALREVAGERGNNAYWRRALDRVEAAAPPAGQEIEEFAAYAIEERAIAPAGIRDVVDRLIGALKAWLLRRFRVQMGPVTPSQLQALATAALRSGMTAPRAAEAYSRMPPGVEEVDAATPGFLHNLVTRAMDGRASLLGLVPLRPLLSEMAGNIPAAQDYLQLKQAMDTVRDQWHARADEVSQRWLKFRMLHGADNVKLMDLMHEATLAGVDPSAEFQSIMSKADNQVLDRGSRHEAYDEVAAKQARDEIRRGDHGRLVATYAALPPEARRLFAMVRNSYTALSRAFEQAMLDNLSRALDIRAAQAQRDFDAEMVRIADSKMTKEAADAAVAAAEKQRAMAQQIAGWAKGARMTRLRHFFETNSLEGPYFPLARFGNFFVTVRDQGDQVVSFSRFEKPAEQQRFAADMRKEGYDVALGVLDDGGDLRKQVDARFVADIEDILEGADVSDAVRDAVWQRWLESMPDMSIRTSRIHRKGRAGYSNDALRAYGHHMFHGAHQLARLKYSLQLDDAISQAREQSKRMSDPVRAGLIVNEMARRNQFVMNPTGGPLAQMVTSAAFFYSLAASPAAALVNTTQTAIMGVPILAAYDGRPVVGAARAANELNRALLAFTTGKGHAGKSARLSPDEVKAMDAAYETGLIERTQSHDLAGVGETGVRYSPARAKVMAAISWAFHHTERMNREVTFLAAYRMARAKGEPHGMAIERASELTWKIHFDYQNTSRPRIMQGDTAKVLFVFRNFNVNMLFRLFRDAHQAVKGGTKAERKVALTQLAGTTGMMMLSAGIRGTWLYGVAIALATLFFGDDAEDEFKKGMIETLGHRLGGMALNGVPGDLLGIDLSNRIGMPDLWFRSPDRELEGKAEFEYWAIQLLGPSAGILRNVWVGASMAGDGHVERGVETIAPKFAKDPMKSVRYLSEGAQTLQGDPILEDMSPADAIKQALGFTPAELAERYERNRSMKNSEQRILDQRRAALNAFDQARRAGEDTSEAEAAIAAFNEENPDYPITVRSLRQSMRSREQMRERKQGGVYLNPKLVDRLNEEAPPLVYGDTDPDE